MLFAPILKEVMALEVFVPPERLVLKSSDSFQSFAENSHSLARPSELH